jgi:hypothetical protein
VRRTYEMIWHSAAAGQVVLIAHTKRDQRFFSTVMGFPIVRDHPLSLMPREWPERIVEDVKERRAELKARYGEDAVLIGIYGFISPYKGFD